MKSPDALTEFPDLSSPMNRRQRIAEEIEKLILTNRLLPGTRLPSEMEFARRFKVSRPTISEALQLLAQRGLVERRTGSGTYVGDVGSSVIGDSFERYVIFHECTFDELMELREANETEAASLAALRATPEDLKGIKACLARINKFYRQHDAAAFAANDLKFHMLIANASHNQLILAIVNAIHRLTIKWIITSTKYNWSNNPNQDTTWQDKSVQSHQWVYEAIVARDQQRAREMMAEHMILARQTPIDWSGKILEYEKRIEIVE